MGETPSNVATTPAVLPARSRPSCLGELPGLALIVMLVVAIFWPLATMRRVLMTGEAGTIDMLYQTFPFKVVLGRALAQGYLPTWTDGIFCGYPLLANPSVGALYPPNWIFAWLPGAAAMGVTVIVACILGGWLAYYYCRTLALGRAAATLGGMAFAGCGFFVAHAKHVAFLQSGAWIPLQLALVERAVQGDRRQAVRSLLWLAPVTGLQVLAGGIPVVYLAVLALGAYALIRLLALGGRGWRFRVGVAGLLVLALGWGAALAAGQLLPTRQLSALSERKTQLSIRSADLCPLPAHDLLTFGWSRAVGWPGDGSYRRRDPLGRGNFWENYSYVGWPTVLLALVALPWALRSSAQGRTLAALAVIGVLLGLGIHTGFYYLAYHGVPGMAYFRFPQRFLLYAQLGLAVLGAMGLQRLLGRIPARWRAPVAAVVLLVALGDLAWAQRGINIYYDATAWMRPPATVETARTALGGQPVRVYTHMGNASYRMHTEGTGVAGNRRQLWQDRALLHPDVNLLWGVPQGSGYAELVPEWSALLWSGQHTQSILEWWETVAGGKLMQQLYRRYRRPVLYPNPETDPPLEPVAVYVQLLAAWNVGYVTSTWRLQAPGLEEIPGADSVHVYRNREVMPRAYLVPRADRVQSHGDVLPLARFGMVDFRKAVYLEGEATAARAEFAPVPARVRAQGRPERLLVQAVAPAPCWLVVTDNWYPGWTARVDGRPAPLKRANYAMRAVWLPTAGRHLVEMRYECRPLAVGLRIGLAALVLWVAAMVAVARLPRSS